MKLTINQHERASKYNIRIYKQTIKQCEERISQEKRNLEHIIASKKKRK
jgi:hypothetical protein